MNNLDNISQLILECDKLKEVFRNTLTTDGRRESTAEHTWSASMIALTMMEELKNEFGQLDEFKIIKLVLIHDIVEIYAGDVSAYDAEGRKEKEKIEVAALEKLMKIYPDFGKQLHSLWHEFERKETIESKIAKAADAICPIFQRLHANQSYVPIGITLSDMERLKRPIVEFSQTFTALYEKLKGYMIKKELLINDLA